MQPLAKDDWGFYDFHGNQMGYNLAGRVGQFLDKRIYIDPNGQYHLANATVGGQQGGLVLLFDPTGSKSLVLSAASSFMAANVHPVAGDQLAMGVMGRTGSIPAGWSITFVLRYGSGIRPNVQGWGSALRARYARTDDARRGDLTNTHLGYSTDNGAFYYYETEKRKNYYQTLQDVYSEIQRKKLPVRHLHLDSWWYPKDNNSAVTEWTPLRSMFPNGWADFDALHKETGFPFTMHNRYWSSQTVYAKQNGGNFTFRVEKEYAIPDDPSFWDFLIGQAAGHGMYNYQQDWLDTEYQFLNITRTDVDIARRWLVQMGDAASKHGVYVQYCMPFSRHVLQALEVPAVSQVRASEDNIHIPYVPNNVWIAASSIVIDALGMSPMKDNFLSSRFGDVFQWTHGVELENRLHSLVATLSTGPVNFGDRIGKFNTPLIMRSADETGRLLQPSSPGVALDKWFVTLAQSRLAPLEPVRLSDDPFLQQAECVGNGYRADLVLGFHMTRDTPITPSDLHLTGEGPLFAVPLPTEEEVDVKEAAAARPQVFTQLSPLVLQRAAWPTFQYWQIMRPLGGTWLLFGELAKWVPSSPNRIQLVEADAEHLNVTVRGSPGESVSLVAAKLEGAQPQPALVRTCTVPAGGVMVMGLHDGSCSGEMAAFV
mmetsp:Transcript_80981/g.185386  ORF Transcript_80981/g.185386 Transcript_80981/m.185386 type:complete len:654 (+) Transcript_80981:2248-4209(+)